MGWQERQRQKFMIKKQKFQENRFCHYCGSEMWMDFSLKHEMGWATQATLDHILPQGNGGSDNPDNFVICCAKCNMDRARIDYDTFKKASDKGIAHVLMLKQKFKKETAYRMQLKNRARFAYI